MLRSRPLPKLMNFEMPRPCSFAIAMRLPPTAPLWEIIAISPAGGCVSSVAIRLLWVLMSPAQFGPTKRRPYFRATARISASPSLLPASEKPEVMMAAALMPAWPQASRFAATVGAGEAMMASCAGSGMSLTAV